MVLISNTFTLVCFAVCTGWYIVWRVFLSRFKLVRELMGNTDSSSNEDKPSELSSSVPNGVRTRSGRSVKRVRIE